MTTTPNLLEAALRYADLGYPIFPCTPGGKHPIVERGFYDASLDPEQIETWWSRNPAANIGMPTSGLLVVDIDPVELEGGRLAANTWPEDQERARSLAAGAVSLTPRGGRHHIFRRPEGKSWPNSTSKIALSVDIRTDGGYIILPPSVVGGTQYTWVDTLALDSDQAQLPEPPEWLVSLLDAHASSRGNLGAHLNGHRGPVANAIPAGQRNATLARMAGTMRRAGMTPSEILAALVQANRDRCSPPLDDREVGKIAASIGRYEPDQITVAMVEGWWQQDRGAGAVEVVDGEPKKEEPKDPGPFPENQLRVPGFISEVMDHCLDTAPYPNTVLAFCGALSLQAVLAGRKVRDAGDNRTNVYVLGLAHSASGKDRPRKLNLEIMSAIGLQRCLGERFASGEGIQDALMLEPSMLFQTDEIDGMLQQVNKSKDARYEGIMSTLLTVYSSSNSVLPVRRRARGRKDDGEPNFVDQPCLSIFGTAIPNHYYSALSERMLTNGFFARMLVFEGKRGPGQEPKIKPVPKRILEQAKRWVDWGRERRDAGHGNLSREFPDATIVPHTKGAALGLTEARIEADAEYAQAEANGNAVGTTVWGRVSEHVRKLALLYAISANPEAPRIDSSAVKWGRKVAFHQARRMLFMASTSVAATPFDADCLRFLNALRSAPDQKMSRSQLLQRLRVSSQTLGSLVQTLEMRSDIEAITVPTRGRPSVFYRLLGEKAQTAPKNETPENDGFLASLQPEVAIGEQNA